MAPVMVAKLPYSMALGNSMVRDRAGWMALSVLNWPIFSDTLAHNYFQRLQRRLVRFSVFFRFMVRAKALSNYPYPTYHQTTPHGNTHNLTESLIKCGCQTIPRLIMWVSNYPKAHQTTPHGNTDTISTKVLSVCVWASKCLRIRVLIMQSSKLL